MKLQNKAILGASVLLGGSVLLYATVNQIMNETKNNEPEMVTIIQPVQNEKVEQPLTADIEVERNILEQKRKEREQQVEEQERHAEKYLSEQQRIEAEALARSRAENQLYVKEEEIARPVVTPRPKTYTHIKNADETTDAEKKTIEKHKFMVVEPKPKQPVPTTTTKSYETTKKPEQIVLKTEKPVQKNHEIKQKNEQKPTTTVKNKEIEQKTRPSHYQVQKGEGLIQLSRRYDVPVEILAKINNLDKNSNLHLGQKIIIPTDKQIKQSQKQLAQEQQKQLAKEQQKQAEELQAKQKVLLQKQQELAKKQQELAQKQEETQRLKEAEQKLKQARQMVKQTDAKGNFGVQIALATDQKKADEIVKQLQSAGYKARTSQTTRGIRVVVGPEKGKEAALALKDKINADPKIKTNEAWVLFW